MISHDVADVPFGDVRATQKELCQVCAFQGVDLSIFQLALIQRQNSKLGKLADPFY